jgi:hypothetical protein
MDSLGWLANTLMGQFRDSLFDAHPPKAPPFGYHVS